MAYIYEHIGILANLYDAAAGVVFLCLTADRADRRYAKGIFLTGTIACIIALTFLQDISENYVIQSMIVVGVLFLYAQCMFVSHAAEKFLFCTLFVMVLLTASAVINIFCANVFHMSAVQVMGQPGMSQLLGCVADKAVTAGLLAGIIVGKRKIQVLCGEWQIGIGLLLASMCIGDSVGQVFNQNSILTEYREQMLTFILGFVLLCVTVVIYIYRLRRQYHLKLENEMMRTRLEEEQAAIQKIRDMYEENQIFRHDLKRYLTSIQGMLISGDVIGAKQYISEAIDTHLQSGLLRYTNSSVIDAVLTDRKNLCEKSGIEFQIYACGDIPETMQLDIGIILSNLLENAYEAELSEPEDKRDLAVHMQMQKDMYYIHVENFISQTVLTSNPELHSRKQNQKKHGFGIRSVKKMAARRDGSCSFYEEDHKFIAEVSLPIPTLDEI